MWIVVVYILAACEKKKVAKQKSTFYLGKHGRTRILGWHHLLDLSTRGVGEVAILL